MEGRGLEKKDLGIAIGPAKIAVKTTMPMLVALVAVALLLSAGTQASGQERIKIGTLSNSFMNYLPVFAAEEGGFSRQRGVVLEPTDFRSGPTINTALAAGHVNIAFNPASVILLAAAAKLPVKMVARYSDKMHFRLWARTDSRFRMPSDLAGARLGVHRLGSTSHAYSVVLLKSEGLEGKVRFVSTGGLREVVAALFAGVVDIAAGYTYNSFVKLALEGKVKAIADTADYLPKEWLEYCIYSRRDFIEKNPETVEKVVTSVSARIDYSNKNRMWSIRKIMSMQNFDEREATLAFEQDATLTSDGRISRTGLENVIKFLGEWKILDPKKLPPVEELYTNQFTR